MPAAPHGSWRFLRLEDGASSYLLAMDEALSRTAAAGRCSPTLKLAAFPRPTVSVGYFQRGSDVDLAACRTEGVPVLRRPSGGGSVLHCGSWDLTYCIVVPAEHSFSLSVKKGFERLCSPLMTTLASFGLAPSMNGYGDIIVGGRKIAGAAQFRRKGVVVIHGYLMVATDLDLLYRLLRKPESKLREKSLPSPFWATSMQREGVATTVADVRSSLVSSYEHELGCDLAPSNPSCEEHELCGSIAKKYLSEEWTILKG